MDNQKNEIEEVKNFFNSYSRTFSSIYSEDDKSRSLFDKLMDKMFRQAVYARYELTLKETIKDEIKTVLDVGCGPGHHTVAFLNQGKTVTALDVADEMVELTKSKVKQINKIEDCDFIVSDYMTHNFEKKFDAIAVLGFFDYVSDPVTVLKKLINDAKQEVYISIPNESGILGLQRKIRYKLRNCPLYSYSKKFLVQCLSDAGCLEYTEIKKTSRGFFVVIRKELQK